MPSKSQGLTIQVMMKELKALETTDPHNHNYQKGLISSI